MTRKCKYMKMICPAEVRCIVCHLIFCCDKCRWNHEKISHGLMFDCPICRGQRFLCRPEELNQEFITHLAEEHLPLQCRKCDKVFNRMEDLVDIDKCVSITELLDENKSHMKESDTKFDSLFEKIDESEGENFEAIVSVNKCNKTAVITPIIRKKYLVDYESSDTEEEIQVDSVKTPHEKVVPKTPKVKRQRACTPHVKKLLTLMRQKAVEEYDETGEESPFKELPIVPDTTPSRNDEDNEFVAEPQSEMTTPTSHLPNLGKLAQTVSTSTPTHPVAGCWTLFPDQGADSPLSEIENAESPAPSIVNEPSKSESETLPPKLKSIMTGSRIRLGSQDSSEKQVTFQDSTDPSSIRVKKVKFAEDTVFQPEPKIKRVYRKPKRMLTPGPQKPKYSCNPRFQALLNRFENHGQTMARTPINTNREKCSEVTPSIGEAAIVPARAINFKDDSPIVDAEKSNELFKTCIESPQVSGVNNALTALTANIAGSLQNCLTNVLKTTGEETEIQFKFVITKKTVSVKRIVEDGEGIDEKSSEVDRESDTNKDNIWATVAKAVKNVFWGDRNTASELSTTPYRSYESNSSSSASKRKFEDLTDPDLSPLNHKRHKYEGRIRGRPPLHRSKTWVSSLRSSHSAEQSLMKASLCQDDLMNQSF